MNPVTRQAIVNVMRYKEACRSRNTIWCHCKHSWRRDTLLNFTSGAKDRAPLPDDAYALWCSRCGQPRALPFDLVPEAPQYLEDEEMNRIARQALDNLERSRKALAEAGNNVCKCRAMMNEEMTAHLFDHGWCRDTRPWVPVCPECSKPQRHGWRLDFRSDGKWEIQDVDDVEVEDDQKPAIGSFISNGNGNGHHHTNGKVEKVVRTTSSNSSDDDQGDGDDWAL